MRSSTTMRCGGGTSVCENLRPATKPASRRTNMYYDPDKNDHGLAHSPFKSCVVPRPIGWISTVSADGVHNLAPYSQFQNLNYDPALVMFSAGQKTSGGRKDTVVNIEATGEFVYNMA